MPWIPRLFASFAVAALLALVSFAGCGDGAGSTTGDEAKPAPTAATGGGPGEAASPAAEPAADPAEEAPAKATPAAPTGSDDRGGQGRDKAAAGGGAKAELPENEGSEETADEPRSLQELGAEVSKQLQEDPRDLEELTEQVRREGRVDSCPELLKGSGRCREGR